MDDETRSAAHRAPMAASGPPCEEPLAALVPLPEPTPGGRGLRSRATAGAAALSATALLVLSFGPSALALSPSDPETGDASQGDRVWAAPLSAGSALLAAPPRSEDEDTES
jgi:hypothetical protein